MLAAIVAGLAVVAAATIGASATVYSKLIEVRNETRTTNAKLATNHGKEPWEYLEMVATVHNEQKALARNVYAARSEVAEVKSELVAHTKQDADNFEALRTEIAELKGT